MAIKYLVDGQRVLARRTIFATGVIWVFIVFWGLYGITTVSDFLGLLGPVQDGVSVVGGVVALIAFLIYVASIIIVGMWIHRAHANLRLAGYTWLEFTPGWAVGWFFVPIANLFKPFQAMRELWNISMGLEDSFAAEADHHLKLWWGAWISGNIIANVISRIPANGPNGPNLVFMIGNLAGIVLSVAAGWFLLSLIRGINDAQERLGIAETFT
jgi:Domain of unknown function (DUF4328)